MLGHPRKAPPKLTGVILGYAVADLAGMVMLALGLGFLAHGPGFFLENFPSTRGGAVLLAATGGGLMLWSAAQIVRHVVRRQDTARRSAANPKH